MQCWCLRACLVQCKNRDASLGIAGIILSGDAMSVVEYAGGAQLSANDSTDMILMGAGTRPVRLY